MRRWISIVFWTAALVAASATLGAIGHHQGWWRFHPLGISRYPIRGIDVSRHRGDIDWPRVARQPGLKFAYIKATEGGDLVDPRFAENWREARQAGLKVGAYHFFTFCRAPLEQAAHFLSVLPRDPDALPPAADLEYGGNCRPVPSIESVRRNLKVFLDAVESKVGRRPVIYVTSDAYEDFLSAGGFENPLWIRSLFWEPSRGWVFWQYDARGEIPGIRGPVDLNVFRGPSDRFDAF